MDRLKVTVCELPDDAEGFESGFSALADHARAAASDLVLLPELPAHPWFALEPEFDRALWDRAVAAHEKLLARLPELAPAAVLATRPLEEGGLRLNQGFVWTPEEGYRRAHEKVYFPDEEGWREARWFHRKEKEFGLVDVAGVRAGFLICSDVMFNEWARRSGRAGAHLLATPRASEDAPRWEVALRMAAVASGAYALSSNRSGPGAADPRIRWGGAGMVVDPEGNVLARTTEKEPFATVEIDPAAAERAKESYPRDVGE